MDFDSYKSDLKNYLRTQPRLRDYDFEGSDMAVLIDLLAYNTFRNNFYLNMAISEGFLDSAQLTNSVRSHAKELNYTPRSAQSAKATVTVTFDATGESQPYIIQKGQGFSSINKNSSYVFSIPETIAVSSPNNTFTFTTDIYEGVYVKDAYTYGSSNTNPFPSFQISNPNVDTSSITVSVFEDASVIGDIYQKTDSLLDLNNSSQVFFLQVSPITGNYEIIFGDGVLGRQPKQGASIIIDYRITQGSAGNGCGNFTINFDPTETGEVTTSVTTTTNAIASTGYDAEDIETTRFMAPRWFQTQERAVVASDYSVLLKQKFPEINAVTAYGGEELSPPMYGKVIIVIDISGVDGIPNSLLQAYTNFIKNRCPVTITPIFIAADHTYIKVNTLVRYNLNVGAESIQRVKTLVMAAIQQFNLLYLNDFNVTLRFSKLIEAIDNADNSIISNITDIMLYKQITPALYVPSDYIVNFSIPLLLNVPTVGTLYPVGTETVVTSDTFTYKGALSSLQDDGNGNIRVVTQISGMYSVVDTVGTCDYINGVVRLSNFMVDSFDNNGINIYVKPFDNDVVAAKNNILSIDPAGINISIQQLTV